MTGSWIEPDKDIHSSAINETKTKMPNMPEKRGDTIFNYWGKADPLEQKLHPRAGHQGMM